MRTPALSETCCAAADELAAKVEQAAAIPNVRAKSLLIIRLVRSFHESLRAMASGIKSSRDLDLHGMIFGNQPEFIERTLTRQIALLKTIKVCTFFACIALANISCAERMNPSDVRPRAIELLAKANAAKTNPLAADESRRLEDLILDEFLAGAPKEEAEEFRTMLSRGGWGVTTKAPDAPDTEEVRTKWALIQAFHELRTARVTAEHLAKNPPFDSTGKTRVQIVFLKELSDPNAEAMIYRRPDDGGYPFLLVREDSLKAPDLFRMVRFAARCATLAKTVAAEEWSSVKRSQIEAIHDGKPTEGYQRIIDEFPAFGMRTIPGLGKVRTVGMWTPTPGTGSAN